MLIDTHCHYNLNPLYSSDGMTQWQEHWAQSQEHGVEMSIVVGTSYESSVRALEIATTTPGLFASIGMHPEARAAQLTSGSLDLTTVASELTELITTAAPGAVVAIGETGLDYFHIAEEDQRKAEIQDQQRALFVLQIKLAEEFSLPLILHVRDRESAAYWEVLELLRTHKKSPLPFVLHCVSGPLDYIKAALEMGGYIGVAGNITYKSADHIRALVNAAPKDRVLLETDAPFLPPMPYRGKTCEPWMVQLTSQVLATECGISTEQLLENTRKVFPTLTSS